MQSFRSVAEYYEVFSDSLARLEREGPLLTELLGRAPGRRAVDLACGTGIHALFLAELGADVSAFDASEEMVRHANRRRPHSCVTYVSGDMRTLEGGPWDFGVCLGNSLSLLGGEADLEATFRAVGHALSPGGLFVTQTLNYGAQAARQPRHRVERRRSEDSALVAVKSLVPDGDRTLLSMAFFRSGPGIEEAATETAILRHWKAQDLRRAAEQAGLIGEAMYGGYDRSAFDAAASTDLIGVFRKA